MIISLDTETTGLDLAHGAMPFIITWCEQGQGPCLCEWPVDPLTRKPEVDDADVSYVAELLDAADIIYMQNAKFDAHALDNVGLSLPWEKVRDTLVMGHLLESNSGHRLDEMCLQYLGKDIAHHEALIREATQSCRNLARREYPHWRIAKEGDENMPSIKGTSKGEDDRPWKNDMWLPRAVDRVRRAAGGSYGLRDQSWLTACAVYACADSEFTMLLGLEMERIVRERSLWAIFGHRMELVRAIYEMEQHGPTLIGEYTENTILAHQSYIAEVECVLVEIAAGYGHELELAKGAALNDNMRDFFYGAQRMYCPRCGYFKRIKHWNGEGRSTIYDHCPKCFKGNRGRSGVKQVLSWQSKDNLSLRIIPNSVTGNASLDKNAMREYIETLDGDALEFVRLLAAKRKHDTDLAYMEMYRRFWIPIEGSDGYYRIRPSINPCGTDHLRCACSNPNLQNVGGQEDKCEDCDGKGCDLCGGTGKSRVSLKECFGPAPGRVWYSMDYRSIEARIPAYEANEPKMIEVFEKPNEPPYWGNLYNLTASVLYPQEYWPTSDVEGEFREKHKRLYKQAKFFVLAKNYGAGRAKGDLLSRITNSYDLVDNEFPNLAALQRKYLRDAERTGRIETLPDRTVDPNRGYPILASRTEDNRILSTTPFNYHISGTACWCKNKALVRCADQCKQWRSEGLDVWMVLEVHDELVFDFPRGDTIDEHHMRANKLRRLMEMSGKDLVPSMPTPVKVDFHEVTWARGVEVPY